MDIAKASVPTTVLLDSPESGDRIIAESLVKNTSASSLDDDRSPLTLSLSPQEQAVFRVFTETAGLFADGKLKLEKKEAQPVVLRIAGGWVRDKLLGIETHDVDVTMDVLTGVEFATLVQDYIKLQSTSTAPTESATKKQKTAIPKIGVIAANPNQSKHLETATMTVEGIDCDFCNLRAQEVYDENSRIPTTTMGTPLEDALRRDFCLNALFYNLSTRLIEDWTGRGLRDLLDEKRIVTPLDPFVTFHDDPLRVLRAIRFAVRLGYTLDERLEDACRSTEVQERLRIKVSRERVGKELEGMLSGKNANPVQGLLTVERLQLANSVFTIPDTPVEGNIWMAAKQVPFRPDLAPEAWREGARALRLIQPPSVLAESSSRFDLRLWVLAVFLLPFRQLSFVDRKGKAHLVVEYMIRESIKFKNRDVLGMINAMETVEAFATLLKSGVVSRLEAGLLLRSTRELWVTWLWVAAALLQSQEGTTDWSSRAHDTFQQILSLRLDTCWKMRPLLDGRALMQSLGLPKGPNVGKVMQEQIKWMLEHPNGSKQDCLEHLQKVRANSGSDQSLPRS